MGNYSLKVKIGDSEFYAEGDEKTVRAQFAEFKDLILGASVIGVSGPIPSRPATGKATLQTDQLGHVFKQNEKDHSISLRITPPENEGKFKRIADAATVLLLGYKKLIEKDDVTATTLTASLRQSGIGSINRIDIPLTQYLADGTVTRAGRGKGTTYRLSNKGIGKAEQLMGQLLERVC